MDGATVAGDEASRLIEPSGRYVTTIDGQLEPRDMDRASSSACCQHITAKAWPRAEGSIPGRQPPRHHALAPLPSGAQTRLLVCPGCVLVCQRSATNRPAARWLSMISSSERAPSSSGMSRLPA